MNSKLAIFVVGESKEFNIKIQRFLFSREYKWSKDNNVYKSLAIICSKIGDPGCITTNKDFQMCFDNFSYYNREKYISYKDYRWFNIESDWDEIIEYFDGENKVEEPNIFFKGKGYRI